MENRDLIGKVALITGSARGIGNACAWLLGEHGASIIIADLDLEKTSLIAKELQNNDIDALPVVLDVSDPDSVSSVVENIISKKGSIDILVNNAGIGTAPPIPFATFEDWKRVLDVNLSGTFLCSQACIKYMEKNKWGRIVNITSSAAQTGGWKIGPAYTASKAGIIGLTKSYALYGAKYGILCNAIAPGLIETEMTKGRDNPDEVPLKRLGTVHDVANTVYYLVSPLSSYITGATIDVNGGIYLR